MSDEHKAAEKKVLYEAFVKAFMATHPELPPADLAQWLTDHDDVLSHEEKSVGTNLLALEPANP